jgi:glycosyltransferase involved in cell wall biosynthesis
MRAKRTPVLLTLDEIEGVRAVLPRLPPDVADEILAVDGGSRDGTREFLAGHGIRVCGQTRRGRGEAFRVGVAESIGDVLVFFSPDGNEDPGDIPRLFEALEAGADMAIASRFLPNARNEEDDAAWPLRKWTNQAFTWIANAVWNRTGRYVTDSINGFRGLRRQAFLSLHPTSVGYTIEYELTIHALRACLRIVELPTVERARAGGETKAQSWATGVAFVRFLLRELRSDLPLVGDRRAGR